MTAGQLEVVRIVKRLGQSGAHFQFREVREQMGIKSGDRNGTSRLHNAFKAMKAEQLIEEVGGGRKRNRYFKVKDQERLRGLTATVRVPPSAPGNGGAAGSAGDKLSRIEAGMVALNERLDRLDQRLDQLTEIWS